MLDARRPDDHVPVLAQQPDRPGRDRGDGARACSTLGARAWSWSTRPTASSRRGRRSTLVDDDVPLVVTRTYSKTWSMAAARLGYLVGPAWVVAELEKVVLPYHLDAAQAGRPGALALDFTDEMEARVAALVEERGRLVAALADLPVDVWPSGANFVLFRPAARATATTCGRRCSTARSSSATARRGPASTAACGSPSARPTRTTRFLAALDGGAGMTPTRAATRRTRRGRPRRPTIAVELDLDGTGRGRGQRPGLPFFDHMLDQLGRHGGFDLTVQATGDLDVDGHHTVEDVGITARRGVRARRSATRPACAASPAACSRSTRR